MKKEHGIIPGPATVHAGVYPPVMKGGVLKPSKQTSEAKSDDFSVSDCMDKNSGKVDNPGAYCASVKDKIVGDTHWRGKEESNSGSAAPQVLRKESAMIRYIHNVKKLCGVSR
jgi:hypothetical protein